eukprot:scaffold51744_cov33-Tisochrysis_lutea.AAC.1
MQPNPNPQPFLIVEKPLRLTALFVSWRSCLYVYVYGSVTSFAFEFACLAAEAMKGISISKNIPECFRARILFSAWSSEA